MGSPTGAACTSAGSLLGVHIPGPPPELLDQNLPLRNAGGGGAATQHPVPVGLPDRLLREYLEDKRFCGGDAH